MTLLSSALHTEGAMAGRSTYNFCLLLLTFALFISEMVIGQICRSLLIAVDSFHTLHLLTHLVLLAFQQPSGSPDAFTSSSGGSSGGSSLHQEPYVWKRLQSFGILVSALLLASQCVSICLEILTHLLQPEPIQQPFTSVVIGGVSLLFNTMVLIWRHKAAEEVDVLPEANADLHSPREKRIALQNESLVFCNPEAPSALDPGRESDECSSSLDKLPKAADVHDSRPESAHTHVSNVHHTSQEDGPSVDQRLEEKTGHDRAQRDPKKPSPVVPFLIQTTRDLLGSVLILVHGPVLLLFQPTCHRPHSDCHALVYLDAGLAVVLVLVLLSAALPRIQRYGLLVLQAAPERVCVEQLRCSLSRVPGVCSLHELHVWQLSDACVVASVHVHCPALGPEELLHLLARVRATLLGCGVQLCTVQPEFLCSSDEGRCSSGSSVCSLRCGPACDRKLCCSPHTDHQVDTHTHASGDVVFENTHL